MVLFYLRVHLVHEPVCTYSTLPTFSYMRALNSVPGIYFFVLETLDKIVQVFEIRITRTRP